MGLKARDLVCSVIVTYNPKMDLLQGVISAALKQCGLTVIYDNSPKIDSYNSIEYLIETLQYHKTIEIGEAVSYHSDQNSGLPKAYNWAANLAEQKGYKFLLILDQDSLLSNNTVNTLVAAYDMISQSAMVGALSAANVEETGQTDDFLLGFYKKAGFESMDGIREIFFAWNSGMMVPLKTINDISGFNESYFLDCADLDFCFRIHEDKKRIFQLREAIITHELHQLEEVNLFGIHMKLRLLQPFRFYYLGRDGLKIARDHYEGHPKLVLFILLMICHDIMHFVLFSRGRQKLNGVYFFSKGIVDYFRKRTGEVQ